ncbi:hypothetical protein B9G98_01986 [Wickerhamiella sorbophila]|uniref:MIP18 family-like domain-containing protein n=1 Tax=Wickerhamiella sorbophila TaxID=45607 RepID=A0A2T0FHA9_9ASCO|nr:hypothetical protein B9G98_01986 [Wickerhamiella sorbophila]PRT54366.1 hypothetical protein B9G98_01986 [Wickerhamiella sorbophila]
MAEPINSNPTVLEEWQLPTRAETKNDCVELELGELARFSLFSPPPIAEPEADAPELTDDEIEPIDAQEIFDLIASISDPEHPLTLGQLAVVQLDRIYVTDTGSPDEIAKVHVEITPTITHCSLATLIGLGIRVRLERSLPPRYRIKITVTPGSHQSEEQVNKQLNDKERVAAACENEQLVKVISQMLATCK